MHSLFTSEELVLDYPRIYGIATPSRHLRVGYYLSQVADFEVQAYEDIITYNQNSVHGAYYLRYLDDNTEYLFIKNRGTSELFYPKYDKVDYLLCSMSEDDPDIDIVKKIKKLTDISLCFALDKPSQKEILNFTQLL